MKKQILLLCAVAGLSLSAVAKSEISFTYAESDMLDSWGASKVQTYDVAIAIQEASLIGCEITKISVPVPNTPNQSGYSVWLSKELTLSSEGGIKLNVPDVWSVDVEPQVENENDELAYLTYVLPEPYTITEEGIYVGYSFMVDKAGGEDDPEPVVVAPNEGEGGFWIHSTLSYRKWKDYSSSQGCVSPMVVSIAGDFNANAAALKPLRRLHCQQGNPTDFTFAIANHGTDAINSVEYKLDVDGISNVGTVELSEPIPGYFNRQGKIKVPFPGLNIGVYDYTLSITKVNGEENPDNEASGSNAVDVLDRLPVKRPVMEEYTGTWCGWCVRGFVALEKMAELHEDFIAIAYHDSDPMQIPYPNVVNGFPDAWMDRSVECDPYFGLSNSSFGIEDLWTSLKEEFSPAEIEIAANWEGDDYQKITVNSNVKWLAGPDQEGEYRVEYVLLADGLSNEDWKQSNYYYTFSPESASEYMEDFCKGGKYGNSKVTGLVYNDVAVQTSGLKGVAGSISNTEAGSENPYSYTFDISNNSIIQNKNKLRVVAMVVLADASYCKGYGLVINSNVCDVPQTSGINDVPDESEEVSVVYYDLSGRVVTNPSSGIFIRASKRSDSTIRYTKIVK